jgi:Na+-transporting NADH:ubiquinone oxidoreductase subunit NqrE
MIPSIALLIIHWVGDYVLQFNEMATRKSQSLKWLTVHVLVYTAALLTGTFVLVLVDMMAFDKVIVFVGVNAALHWITDLVTSRVADRVSDRPRLYYPLIGFDQLLHSVTLLSTFHWLA